MNSTLPSADVPDDAAPYEPPPGRAAPFERSLPWLLLVGGLVGAFAAIVLTIEKIQLALDPDYIPSCNFNPVLNCGSVVITDQASAFGFPNSLMGIFGFAVVVATGAGLLAGASFARWYWMGLQIGVTFAVVFIHWLMYQSLYVIGALCPWCMVVWVVTVPIFLYVTLRNLHYGTFTKPVSYSWATLRGNHFAPILLWAMIVLVLIGIRFWSYWSTLI